MKALFDTNILIAHAAGRHSAEAQVRYPDAIIWATARADPGVRVPY